jgi:hypothetical protein
MLGDEWEYSGTVHRLLRKGMVQLREFGIPIKLVRLIKICLNETCGSQDRVVGVATGYSLND